MSPRRLGLCLLAVLLPGTVIGPAAAADRPVYVALGDSYSSGVGAEEAPPGPCFRSDGAYAPGFTRRDAGRRYDLVFHACAGAETRHVIKEGQRDAGQDEPQIDKLEELAELTRLVTITIGGNDARFGEIVASCAQGFRSCTYYYGPGGERGDQSEWIEQEVRPRLIETYRLLADAAPRDRLIVLTYPQIFQDRAECRYDAGISNAEKRWIREQTAHLNDVIQEEADGAGLEVLDVEDDFGGHEICTADPYAAGAFQPGTFHPNARGYDVLADRLAGAVG